MFRGFYSLLDLDQQLLIRIAMFFYRHNISHITTPELRMQLGISTYQVNFACQQLHEIGANDSRFDFTYDKEAGLTLAGVTTQTIEFLTVLLAKKSLTLKVLLNGSLGIGGSRANFLKNYGVSQSTYYRIKHKMLENVRVDFPVVQISNEIEARAILQHVAFFFFASGEFPLHEYREQITDTLNFVTRNWNLDLTNSERKEVTYFMAVQLLRIKNMRKILTAKDDLLLTPTDLKFQRAHKYLQKNWELTEEQAYHEAMFFNAYLIVYDDSLHNKQALLKRDPEIEQLTEQQLHFIEAQLHIKDCRREFPGFYRYLRKINVKSLSPFFFINTYIDAATISELEHAYPLINVLASRFVKLRRRIQNPQISETSSLQLYYHYSLLLLTAIPNSAYNDQIHIVADFSTGRIFTGYIQQQLKKMTEANIVIDSKIDNNTDLYLSDKYDVSVKNDQITWNCPPTSQDWYTLRSVVIQKRMQKNKKAQS